MLINALVLFILINCRVACCARILGIFHERSFSHQILGIKLLSELASRGHQVTMVTPVVPKTNVTNFTVIELDLEGQGTAMCPNIFDTHTFSTWNRMVDNDEMGLLWAETVLKDKNLQALLKSNQYFDLVIMEQLENHALKGICYRYKAICVILSTLGPTWLTNEQMRNPHSPSYMVDMYVDYQPTMNFYQRFHNAYVEYLQRFYFYSYTINKHNELVQKYFPGAPHMMDLQYNVSLMLLNSHFSTSNPASNLPYVVEVGGFHIDPPKKLPEHIEKFLNEAEYGAIYFSMGSILRAQNMRKDRLEAVIKVLGQLPHKVLWVADFANPSKLPSNIMLVKWAPQLDVLAHPNVRLFISHGGLLSLTESISCGVPILGISVYADQGYNSAFAEACGFGISLPYELLNEEKFRHALYDLLSNPIYTKNAKMRSKIFHDHPVKPLDNAMFWIEYVIRYNGAPHLRSAALNLAWHQYLLLDVLFLVFLIIFVITLLLKKIFTTFCRKYPNRESNKKRKVQ